MAEMKEMGMVERMAEAMFDRFQQCVAHNFKRWKDWTPQTFAEAEPEVRAYYVASARAGLEMLRQPTKAMIRASASHAGVGPTSSRGAWTAMLDAALSQDTPHDPR